MKSKISKKLKFRILLAVVYSTLGYLIFFHKTSSKPDEIQHDFLQNSNHSLRVMSIIGTRPETIKMFPVINELQQRNDVLSIVLATGQHQEMVAPLLKTFGIKVDINLNVMVANQKLPDLSVKLMSGISDAIAKTKPDWILVQGDTTSAFIASVAAFYHKVPVGHVEAGLRTYQRYNPFPEELNRRVIGSLASVHFAPTSESYKHLIKEGLPNSQVQVTGNTVIDALKWMSVQPPTEKALQLERKIRKNCDDCNDMRIVLVTAHRRENWGKPLENICKAIKALANEHPTVRFVFPMHMNPEVRRVAQTELAQVSNVVLCEPLDYDVFAHLMKSVYLVMTDSGGIQEEATAFSVPILVLRETTERPEGVNAGVAKLVGTKETDIFNEGNRMLVDLEYYKSYVKSSSPYGDGKAAKRIVETITSAAVHSVAVSGSMSTELSNDAVPVPPSPPKMAPNRSLKDILEMKSRFPENGDGVGENGITAIISTYKRPKTIIRIVEAIANQSIPPKEIWITAFSSPFESEYRKLIDEYNASGKTKIPIHLITGAPQFTYFARFQVGLLAPTKYVAIFDDDVIPEGVHAFRNMLHTFNLESNDYYGMYGCKGHVINTEQKTLEQSEYYYNYFTHEPKHIEQADVVGGLWFMKREWVKFMFVEDPITYATGEDFQLTAMLSKHANIPTYIFPVDMNDKTSFLHSGDFLDIADGEKTTGDGLKHYNGADWDPHHLRNAVAWYLLNRGMTRPRAYMMYERHINVMFYVKDNAQAQFLVKAHQAIVKLKEEGGQDGKIWRPFVSIGGLSTHTDQQNSDLLTEIQATFGTSVKWKENFLGYWTLELGRGDYGLDKGKDLISRTLLSFHHQLVNTQPIAVVLTTSKIDESTAAAGLTAVDYGTPVVVLDSHQNDDYPPYEKKWRKVLLGLADRVVTDEADLLAYLKSIRTAMTNKA
ncbi:hypothetical protein HDV04_001610 [Boothiomyces sp. JEL0838]|nr:hypothetical protein HDV04_001610 [Boothiomyces sp. JEL0838]